MFSIPHYYYQNAGFVDAANSALMEYQLSVKSFRWKIPVFYLFFGILLNNARQLLQVHKKQLPENYNNILFSHLTSPDWRLYCCRNFCQLTEMLGSTGHVLAKSGVNAARLVSIFPSYVISNKLLVVVCVLDRRGKEGHHFIALLVGFQCAMIVFMTLLDIS